MKTIHTSNWLLIALVGLIAYQLFLGRQSLKEAKALSTTLLLQLDTLQDASHKLVLLHQEYEGIYHELNDSKAQMIALQQHLEQLAAENIVSVSLLQQELHMLLTKYDSVRFPLPIVSSTDDLTFQP